MRDHNFFVSFGWTHRLAFLFYFLRFHGYGLAVIFGLRVESRFGVFYRF